MPKKADADVISKRHDTTLWAEIRTLYESKQKYPYAKIKSVLMAEFGLDKFPAQRTVERRAKAEEWKRAISEGDRNFNNTFNDEFWLCVRSIYESNGKLSYKRLKELVENELQCKEFPSAQAINAQAKANNWARVDTLVLKDDAQLKKLKQSVNRAIRPAEVIVKEEKNKGKKAEKNEGDKDDDSEENAGELIDFDAMMDVIDAEKRAISNLLMSTKTKRRNMIEVILSARKRMATMNEFADEVSDELALNFALLHSKQFNQVFGKDGLKFVKEQMRRLGSVASVLNELSFNRRESIKFELSLYGVSIEDLQKAGEEHKVVSLDDNTAYEAQKRKLLEERERIAERTRYIESGGFQSDADAELQRRMREANPDDAESIEYEEVEVE